MLNKLIAILLVGVGSGSAADVRLWAKDKAAEEVVKSLLKDRPQRIQLSGRHINNNCVIFWGSFSARSPREADLRLARNISELLAYREASEYLHGSKLTATESFRKNTEASGNRARLEMTFQQRVEVKTAGIIYGAERIGYRRDGLKITLFFRIMR